jgi:hypothetical protein
MDDFGDRMMEFLFEAEAPDQANGEMLTQALAAFPGEEDRVYGYWRAWAWEDWCDANLPPAPEPTEEELERFAQEGLRLFYAALDKRKGL